jgi:hypothetical protein
MSPGYILLMLKVASIFAVKVRIESVISPGVGRVKSSPKKSLGSINLHLKCFFISACNLETAFGVPAMRDHPHIEGENILLHQQGIGIGMVQGDIR